MTGTSYGIIAPLVHGVTVVVDAGEFDAMRWHRILEQHHATIWYTAPTALSMLMRHGIDLPRGYDLVALRLVASAGEPLTLGSSYESGRRSVTRCTTAGGRRRPKSS